MFLRIHADIELDPKWRGNFTDAEIMDMVRQRLESSMGFRLGRIRRLGLRHVLEPGDKKPEVKGAT